MPDASGMSAPRKSLALLTLVVALVLEIVDVTIVNTALPAIKTDLGAGPGAAQWIVAGYSLSLALLLLTGGRLGDSFGYRRIFIIGVAGFTLASVACGLARTPEELVIARILQGGAGAIMGPQFMALMQIMFDPLERVSKLALFGLVGGIAAIAGPVVGGLLIAANLFGLGWRVVFLINLPIGIVAMVMASNYLPPARSARPAGYDVFGVLLFGAALAVLLGPLMGRGIEQAPLLIVGAVALAAVLFVAGWRHLRQRVSASRPALFDPQLFTIDSFRVGLIIAAMFGAATAGFLLIFAFALQAERGETPLSTGLLHVPFGIGTMIGIAVLSRKLLPRFGRWIAVAGAVLMAISGSLVLLGIGTLRFSTEALVPLLILTGLGMGMVSGCVPSVTVSRVPRDDAGAASGLLKTGQQLGNTIGIALAGGVYFAWGTARAMPPSFAAGVAVAILLAICALAALRLPQNIFGALETGPPRPQPYVGT